METLEHLDADSETDAISDIQPVQNVMPNVCQASVILASVRHQTHVNGKIAQPKQQISELGFLVVLHVDIDHVHYN